jgi:hypothetical protein
MGRKPFYRGIIAIHPLITQKMIKQAHRNSHIYEVKTKMELLCISDVHWDNPKCDRETLVRHLDRFPDAKIAINGDLFCYMQGRFDPRGSKKDILPEHNKANYLDAVIEDAVQWWGPYKDRLILIGYGNHETNILKRLETDPLRRFVDLFNYVHKSNVQLGGYGGWLTVQFKPTSTMRKSYTIHYFHGSGGGGAVTKGTIQHQRKMADVEGADCIWMGHVHELYTMIQTKATLDSHRIPVLKDVLHLRTGAYKEEYQDGFGGWHIERGAPAKPIGCIHLEIGCNSKREIYAIPTIITK